MGVSVTASSASKHPRADRAYAIEEINRAEAQNGAARSDILGLTVGDIYDLGVIA
jgi:hypothetical protein